MAAQHAHFLNDIRVPPLQDPLAESLALLFIGCGGRIVRREMPVDVQGSGTLYIYCGSFLSFLETVIGPLHAHLQMHGLRVRNISRTRGQTRIEIKFARAG